VAQQKMFCDEKQKCQWDMGKCKTKQIEPLKAAVDPDPYEMIDINKRIHIHHVISQYISKLPSCLVSYGSTWVMGDELYLKKQIGSPSAYGVVYIASGKSVKMPVAVKIMERWIDENIIDTIYLDILSKLSLQKRFLHFPITYAIKECREQLRMTRDNSFDQYFVVIGELANGDFLQWTNEVSMSYIEYTSAFGQIIFVIFKLSSIGIRHNDSKPQNFLYHNVPAGGHWWYKFQGRDLYIKNTGQLWIINDFGTSYDVSSKYNSDQLNPRDLRTFFINLKRENISNVRISTLIKSIYTMIIQKDSIDFGTLLQILIKTKAVSIIKPTKIINFDAPMDLGK
jgi:hypothetical protein